MTATNKHYALKVSSYSAAVRVMVCKTEIWKVVGSNRSGGWAFPYLLFPLRYLLKWRVLDQVSLGGKHLLRV